MRIWWLAVVLGLSACSNLPISYAPQDRAGLSPELWRLVTKDVVGETDLLSLVPNTDIEPWLDKTLAENPALNQAMLELAEAGWVTRQVGAGRLPGVSLATDTSRQRQAEPLKTLSTSTNYGLALSTRWELDVWGRLTDSHDVSTLEESALAADFMYAQRLLAANFIKGWLAWVNAKQLLAVEEGRLKTLLLNEIVVKDRYSSGLGRLQDLETTRADTEQASANVAAQAELLAASERQLQKLLGVVQPVSGLPNHWPNIAFPKVELPAYSMGQRPDLLAAYQRIQAADKRNKIAYKNLLPCFMNLDMTQSRLRNSNLLSTDPGWLLLGQLTQPYIRRWAFAC